jgi:hypothetical protein
MGVLSPSAVGVFRLAPKVIATVAHVKRAIRVVLAVHQLQMLWWLWWLWWQVLWWIPVVLLPRPLRLTALAVRAQRQRYAYNKRQHHAYDNCTAGTDAGHRCDHAIGVALIPSVAYAPCERTSANKQRHAWNPDQHDE